MEIQEPELAGSPSLRQSCLILLTLLYLKTLSVSFAFTVKGSITVKSSLSPLFFHLSLSPSLPPSVQSVDCLILVSDFNPSRTPTGGGKKFYLSSGTGTTPPLSGRSKSTPALKWRLIPGEELK